jgi:hypothetical protein
VKPFNRRITQLEGRFASQIQPDFAVNPTDRLRLVVSSMDHILNLGASTCRRILTVSGCLTEVVRLDGIRGSLTDEELDRFVEGFPVERI